MTDNNVKTPDDGAFVPPEPSSNGKQLGETPVPPWKYLVRREHSWRMQLYIKGRRLTARQLIGSMLANGFTDEQSAEDYSLPVEAVREALAYVEQNKDLLATEAEIERLMLQRGGVARGPQPVS